MVSRAIRTAGAALAVLVAASLAASLTPSLAFAKGPPVVAVSQRRFDHDRHAASAGAAGKPVACAGCHADRPGTEHARCAGCHAFPSSCSVMKTPGPAGPARVCRTCHTPTRLDCLPRDLPPLPAASSFAAKFTHARHLAVGSSVERDCGVCHRAEAGERPAQKAHVLCSGCHNPNGARPAMTECTTCHASGKGGAPAPGNASHDPYRIAGFDHRAHTAASRLTACLSCHEKAVGDALTPTMPGCQSRCHDGRKAFSATGTHCTTCHRGTAAPPPVPGDLGFSHAEHRARNVKIDDCAACHALAGDGAIAAPLSRKDHLPCAGAGCHQREFSARAPKICGTCHDTAAPWARTAARPSRRPGTDWSEAMNHASHLALAAAGKAVTCEGCHGDRRTGGEPPRDHRACATCHARGQAPAMTECAACHASGDPPRQASPWSVAATFDHVRHATDPRSHRATACTECHTQIAAARDRAAVAPPRMADCDGCHDGKLAFKTTGFGCARCHGGKPPPASTLVPAPAPASGASSVARREAPPEPPRGAP